MKASILNKAIKWYDKSGNERHLKQRVFFRRPKLEPLIKRKKFKKITNLIKSLI